MTPAFALGDNVVISPRDQPGHVRTPCYLRGRRGRIIQVCGAFPDPELLAQGTLGIPYRVLYRVAFALYAVWPDYAGAPSDDLIADLYEHWLESEEKHP
ncbi:MAG: nitrile hydratase subunit beta [Alphaproteobacteria bacterium]|nr:nitrile hydratase subunit beta [Alphaproteobacteria bacterium]